MERNKDRGRKPTHNHQVTLKCAGCQKELLKVTQCSKLLSKGNQNNEE